VAGRRRVLTSRETYELAADRGTGMTAVGDGFESLRTTKGRRDGDGGVDTRATLPYTSPPFNKGVAKAA